MRVTDEIRGSSSLIKYLLTELERVAVVDGADVEACGEQLRLWAEYASQELYVRGYRQQSDWVYKLSAGLSAAGFDPAHSNERRSDLIYRIEICRGILEELLDTRDVNALDQPDSLLNNLKGGPEVDDDVGSRRGAAVTIDGRLQTHVNPADVRGSSPWRRVVLLLSASVLIVSATLFLWPTVLDDIAAVLGVGETSPRKAGEPRPPSGVSYQELGRANSIFLTKLDGAPQDLRQQKFTIWVAAAGNITYVIDSVKVVKRGGIFGSDLSSGPPEDADYVINYNGYNNENHTLKPPIILTPSERELSFTLFLRDVTEYGLYCDKVEMEIHYTGSDGTEGKLYVREPPEAALTLSRLLETDIQSDGLITTPQGIQRGVEGNRAAAPRLIYEPVENMLIGNGDPALTPNRIALDKAVLRKKLTPKVIELLDENDLAAFDLCSTLPDSRCETALVRAGTTGGHKKEVLHYLSLRHSLRPSAALADFILSLNMNRYAYAPGEASTLREAARAIARHPSGRWVQALLALAPVNRDASSLLHSKTDSMTKAERRMVEDFFLGQSGEGAH